MLTRLHPFAKLGVALVWLTAASLILDIAFLAGSLVVAVALLLGPGKVRPRAVALAAIPFALFGFGFLWTAIAFREDGGYVAALSAEAALSSDAARAGVALFLRAMTCGMISFVFAATTDPGALARAAMAQGGLPPRIGYALFATLNAAPRLADDYRTARQARAMRRGRPPGRWPGPREAATMLVPLLAGAIRRASDTAIAMEARGFRHTARPTILGAPAWRRSDSVCAAIGVALITVAVGVTTLST